MRRGDALAHRRRSPRPRRRRPRGRPGRDARHACTTRRSTRCRAEGGDLDGWTRAVLGAASVYLFGAEPGKLPAQLYDVLARTTDDATRARLAAALARCWAYAGQPAAGRPVRRRGGGTCAARRRPGAGGGLPRRRARGALGARRARRAPVAGRPARRRRRPRPRSRHAAAGPPVGAAGRLRGARPAGDAPADARPGTAG